MLIKGFAVVAGRKRPFLVGVLFLAATLGVLTQVGPVDPFPVLFVLSAAMIGLSALAALRHRPAVLSVRARPPAFATAPPLAPVFLAAAFILLAGGTVSEDVGDVVDGEELWAMNVVTAGFWVLVVALYLYVTWGSLGVRLRPDGLHDRQLLGSLFIPWAAFAPDYPAVPVKNGQLALYFQRPDLVRRRGLLAPLHALPTGTDAAFLARVIHQYVSCPERRAAIGTEAELRRLDGVATPILDM